MSIPSSYEDDFDINAITELEEDSSKRLQNDFSDAVPSNKTTDYITTDSSEASYDRAFIAEENLEEISLPSQNHDMISAKAYLQKPSAVGGVSLYDHLSDILEKVITERPKNVIDFFEDYSLKMKEARFQQQTDHLKDIYVPPWEFNKSQKLLPLLKSAFGAQDPNNADQQPVMVRDEETVEDEENRADVMETLYYFEQAGVGMPRNEMFCIALAMNKLSQNKIIHKIRYWGKILGIESNYIVVETELSDEEYNQRNMDADALAEAAATAAAEAAAAEAAAIEAAAVEAAAVAAAAAEAAAAQKLLVPVSSNATGEGEQPGEGGPKAEEEVEKPFPEYPIPKSTYVPPQETPAERSGEGANKKVYYVCHEPGDEWVMLPDVTPKQIVVARKIKKYFTGNLDTEVVSFPLFPGKEVNYLRAQIARISSGTQISPLGYYSFGGGEEEEEEVDEEEEEAGGGKEYSVNANFEVLPLADLIDVSMSYWVHHTALILKQGRTAWWDPNAKTGDDEGEEEEGEEEEEKEGGAGEERQVGPPLLTPLSEDPTLESIPPWSTRAGSVLLPKRAVAVVRSNLWPGAHSFATGKKFENVYMGYGLKYVGRNYSPPGMDGIQSEYPVGPEILEMVDPTPEEEEAWRIAHLPKPKPVGEEEGEGAEEEEEEMEEEEDDD